jgi:hypothetical protein
VAEDLEKERELGRLVGQLREEVNGFKLLVKATLNLLLLMKESILNQYARGVFVG